MAMTGSSSGAAKPAITQRDLEEFLALKGQLSSLKGRYAQARQRLLRLVEGDVPVEPGRLQVEVQESVHHRISKSFLVAILGEEDYECMRSEAPPTVYRRLVVGERDCKSTSTLGQGAGAHGWTVFARKDRP
jgi:hypothetical protein